MDPLVVTTIDDRVDFVVRPESENAALSAFVQMAKPCLVYCGKSGDAAYSLGNKRGGLHTAVIAATEQLQWQHSQGIGIKEVSSDIVFGQVDEAPNGIFFNYCDNDLSIVRNGHILRRGSTRQRLLQGDELRLFREEIVLTFRYHGDSSFWQPLDAYYRMRETAKGTLAGRFLHLGE